MSKTEIRKRLDAIKYVENTKTGNIGYKYNEYEDADGNKRVECTPIGATKPTVWKNYRLIEKV